MIKKEVIPQRRCGKRQAASALLALVFSIAIFTSTNPIWNYAGVDSACFILVGRGVLNGLVPYVDLIDNKGPVLYLINALAQMPFMHLQGAASTIGVWLLELLFLYFSLRIVDWMCEQLHCKWGVAIQAAYLFLLLPLIETGDMGEEFSNLFTLAAFAVVLKFVFDAEEKKLWWYGFCLGILFALSFLIRPNNALPIAAIVFVLAIGLSVQRRFSVVAVNILSFLLGVLLIFVPIILYLWVNGAVRAWLQQTIFVNLQYSGDSNHTFMTLLKSTYGMAAAGMFILTMAGVVLARRRSKDDIWKWRFFLLGTAFSGVLSFYSAFISGFAYFHYLMVGTGPLIVSIILLNRPAAQTSGEASSTAAAHKWKHGLREVCAAFFCIFLMFLSAGQISRIPDNLRSFLPALKNYTINGGYRHSELQEMAAIIPATERDSVYILDSGSSNASNYYVQMNLFPAFPAFIAVDRFCRLLPGLEDDFDYFFEETPPKWLINDMPLEDYDTGSGGRDLQNEYKLVQTTSNQVSLYVRIT